MAATRYGYIAIYNKPRHVVGRDTSLGHVEVQAGVLLALYEGMFTMEDFASAVRAYGVPGGLVMFPEHAGTIFRSWSGSVAWLLLYYMYMTLFGLTPWLLKCTRDHTIPSFYSSDMICTCTCNLQYLHFPPPFLFARCSSNFVSFWVQFSVHFVFHFGVHFGSKIGSKTVLFWFHFSNPFF